MSDTAQLVARGPQRSLRCAIFRTKSSENRHYLFPSKYFLLVKLLFFLSKTESHGLKFNNCILNFIYRNWNEEVRKAGGEKVSGKKTSLQRAIVKTFYKSYAFYGLLLFLQCVVVK